MTKLLIIFLFIIIPNYYSKSKNYIEELRNDPSTKASYLMFKKNFYLENKKNPFNLLDIKSKYSLINSNPIFMIIKKYWFYFFVYSLNTSILMLILIISFNVTTYISIILEIIQSKNIKVLTNDIFASMIIILFFIMLIIKIFVSKKYDFNTVKKSFFNEAIIKNIIKKPFYKLYKDSRFSPNIISFVLQNFMESFWILSKQIISILSIISLCFIILVMHIIKLFYRIIIPETFTMIDDQGQMISKYKINKIKNSFILLGHLVVVILTLVFFTIILKKSYEKSRIYNDIQNYFQKYEHNIFSNIELLKNFYQINKIFTINQKKTFFLNQYGLNKYIKNILPSVFAMIFSLLNIQNLLVKNKIQSLNLQNDLIASFIYYAQYCSIFLGLFVIMTQIIETGELYGQLSSVMNIININQIKEKSIKTNLTGKIIFKDASSKNNESLQNINISFNPGEIVTVIGKSGSGKSSLLNSILQITNMKKNSVFVECNTNNNEKILLDIKKYDFPEIFLLSQNPLILNDNLRNNLTVFDKSYSDEDIIYILKLVKLYDIVEKRGGLSVMVNNYNFSGGEKQRINIARILLRILKNKIKILCIDELDTGLDLETGENILDLIIEQCKKNNITLLYITHNPKLMIKSHRIVYIDQGQIIEDIQLKDLTPNNKSYKIINYYNNLNN